VKSEYFREKLIEFEANQSQRKLQHFYNITQLKNDQDLIEIIESVQKNDNDQKMRPMTAKRFLGGNAPQRPLTAKTPFTRPLTALRSNTLFTNQTRSASSISNHQLESVRPHTNNNSKNINSFKQNVIKTKKKEQKQNILLNVLVI
jgi:hypothetical protein